jgi:hypothetical protein
MTLLASTKIKVSEPFCLKEAANFDGTAIFLGDVSSKMALQYPNSQKTLQ